MRLTGAVGGLGDYEFESWIGKGSSGTVWRALRRGPVPQIVAVKRLHDGSSTAEDLAQLRREAMLLSELDHPHIVRVLEVLPDGEGIAIAMQYAPGGSLEALLAERKRLTPGEVVAIAVPIAGALGSAHRKRILHLDVKPANILFTSDGEPLLGDFGVARTLGRLTAVLGGQSHIAGTAHYIAPELLDGATPDDRSDVYSLGVVCYEALTGGRPFDAVLPLAVLRAADAGRHVPLTERPDIPAALAEIIERAISRDPGHRFATAGDLAAALRAALPAGDVHLPGAAPVAPPAAPPPVVAEPPIAIEIEDAAADDADATIVGTRTFGPRPPRPEPAVVRQPRFRWPSGPRDRFRLGITAAAAVAVAALLVLVRSGGGGKDCPEVEEPIVDVGAQVVEGDPEGDGCATFGVYQLGIAPDEREDMLLTIRVDGVRRSIRLGELGDRVFLGDWDCDGDDTPGLYRWTDGEVQYVNRWPAEGDGDVEPDETEPAPARGRASLVDEPADGCDRIAVREGAGS